MEARAAYQRTIERLSDWKWRLNNLYTITNKDGEVVPFVMNGPQDHFFGSMHGRNTILKARQLGFSTKIAMFMLDQCVFNSHTTCGIIDARLDDAKKKLGKIRFAWEQMPEDLKAGNPLVKSSSEYLEWANGSSISASTTHRGGTLQYLHVSELGKIAAKFPLRADEIITGAFNAVGKNCVVFIESTAEGEGGWFYDICEQARANIGQCLTSLDFKFHFYPWWDDPEYTLDGDVTISDDLARYFLDLEKDHAIFLTDGQKRWYAKTKETQRKFMWREYPSTPDEAFAAQLEGAVYGDEMRLAQEHGHIGEFPAYPNAPVHTAWDIGRNNYTAIWFYQVLVGEIRILKYFQNNMEGMPYYAKYVNDTFEENGWIKGVDIVPHDARVKEWLQEEDRSRLQAMQAKGLNPCIAVELSLEDGMDAVRAVLPKCKFHRPGVTHSNPKQSGLTILRSYQYEWDDGNSKWKDAPKHDWASDGADAFRMMATSYREIQVVEKPVETSKAVEFRVTEHGTAMPNMSVKEMIAAKKREAARTSI